MTSASSRGHGSAGFSMLEMLISLVILSLVMTAAVSVLRSQSRSFLRGGASMDLNQNARFAMSTTERVARTLGAGVPADQPMLVYADSLTLVFNTNYASNTPDPTAVNINPDLPAAAALGLTTATPVTIPGTAITYPTQNYSWAGTTPSRAETMMFYFRPDSMTPDPTDYVLMQRVNAVPAEMVARNLRPYPGRPFFRYWYQLTEPSGNVYAVPVLPADLPVRHAAPRHGSSADTGRSARADSVRMLQISFVATNGMRTADSTSRAFSTMITLPNNGLVSPTSCGAPPLNAEGFAGSSPAPGNIEVHWRPSGDESFGERDVSGYNLYYRLASATQWKTWTTQAAGFANYSITAGGFLADSTYAVGIAAQDCTPQESAGLVTGLIHVQP